EMIELAVKAEQLGYDSAWVAEHHFANYGLCPAPPVLLAAIAQKTEHIRIGPAVCVLPFHDPVKVAEEYAVLDVVSGGRLDFGVGRGYLAHEYAGHLVDREESQGRFDEALEVIERAWQGEPFEYTGRFHRYPRLALNTLPLQQPAPPIALAALSPATYARIGAQGYNLMAVPYILEDLSVLKGLLASYTAHAQENHRVDNGPRVMVAFHIHVAPTQAAAEARARSYMTRYCETRAVGNTKTFDQLMQQRLIAVGDPDHVADILQQLASFGVERVLCLMNFGGMPFPLVLDSLTLTAQEVMPRLASRVKSTRMETFVTPTGE
ncbi:MAG: LLM class flavin-dependent oxidoreductase, partial [Deltaproteobacteria bacterium]|nr:LLM class flavin-dependent oxidoreductase [Deltaproteobacteria bacterium]